MNRLSRILARSLALGAAVAITVATLQVQGGPARAWASDEGCTPARPHASGSFVGETITTSDALLRTYNLHVPTSYDGSQATPLVFNFHGLGSNAIEQDFYSQLPLTGEAEGFILVTPQGTLNGSGIPYWNSGGFPPPAVDDVAFTDELLTALQAELCIDAARVYSTGLSNGGFMSSRLACSLSDRIAAVAPVAGTNFPGGCGRAMPVIAFHGTADTVVPLAPIESISIPAWAAHNNCAAPVLENPLAGTSGIRLTRYEAAGCDDDAPIDFYVIFDVDLGTSGDQGGGHTWPGSTLVLPPALKAALGHTTMEISANSLMWEFFQEHPHPDLIKPQAVGGIALSPGLPVSPQDTAETNDEDSMPFGFAVVLGGVVLAVVGGWLLRRRAAP